MDKRQIQIFGFLSLLSISVYLLVSYFYIGIGFPLDDAWIHQTYARNLVQSGQWVYQKGQLSGGSTGPLWGLLLSIPYLIGLTPFWGTFALGVVCLWAMAVIGMHAIRFLQDDGNQKFYWVGLLLVFEWHLVWAAASGMETILFAVFCIAVGTLLMRKPQQWFNIGFLVGLSVWLRPGGITLIGPALFVLILTSKKSEMIPGGGKFLVGVFLPISLYLLFNWKVAGDLLPNTFYAKQNEYAVLRSKSIIQRVSSLGLQPLVGVGVLMLPGFILTMVKSIQDKTWAQLALPLWALGYLGIYAWRLPVTYQHGRYLIPMMPVLFVWGLSGLLNWIDLQSASSLRWIVSRAWIVTSLLITLVFWGYGARAYAQDVAVIETEMVKTAKWIAANTEQEAVIAAHDIGALGFFTERQIVDMAGLVSPEVIPFIRDEKRLANYLDESNADYVVAFPSWYPDLVDELEVVYRTQGEYAPRLGHENMAVYHWP